MDPNLDVEALFAEFCRTREPACLGEIFDRCAEELFAIALHLGRDRALAEDLVQSTFLVAIERARTWQPSRPLRPWLLGILHREAKVAQRRARRRVDSARVQRDEEQAPPQAALTAEAREAVATSLRAVPAPYREVLELHYVQGLPPARVAEALRRSPGAVRTQLWRGLALLRNALPAAFATSLGALLEAQVPLAAARAQVLAAAGKPVLATSAVTIAGGVLMKKVLMVVAALLLLPLAYQVLAPRPAPMAPGEPAITARASAVATTGVSPSPAPEVLPDARRIAADPEARAAESPAAAPDGALVPGELNVLVVDLRGDPIADAQVAWYAPKLARTADGREVSIENREHGTLRQQRATDASGRTVLLATQPCLVTAHKPGSGWSGDCVVRSGAAAARELRLVLRPTGRVRGIVLAASGSPVPGATVRGFRIAAKSEFANWLPPVVTGADGRFELEAIADGDAYWLLASLGSKSNRPQSITVAANQVVEVTLQFAGAFVVRGQLVDENGAPVAGRILLHGDESDPSDSHDWGVDSSASGRFEFELTQAGSYSLCAGIAGRTPATATVVLDTAHPQAAVTLRVSPFVAVTGRVVDERNTPLAGRNVMLSPEVDPGTVAAVATRSSLIGRIEPVTTDAEGAFRVMAPADWRYRALVEAVAGNRELWSRSEPFTTPANGVLVVVRAADAQGYVLTGRVVAQSDAAKIAVATIERLDEEGGSRSAQPVGRTSEGTFRVGPFPTGRSYRFSFEAEGFARTIVGPFDAGVRTDDIVVRMPRLGSVRCRVLRADGTPAVAAFVSLEREVDDPFGRAWQGETDRTGCIELRDVEPQTFRVHARATRGAGSETTAPVAVQPGQPSDVLLTLPR